jgi:hypothetical protein
LASTINQRGGEAIGARSSAASDGCTGCSNQFGLASAPIMPHAVQTICWPNHGTATFIGVVIGTDHRLVLAIWVDAVHGETTHAELAHVAERHRIAGWVLGFHFRNGTGYTSLLVMPSAVLANFSFASAKRV